MDEREWLADRFEEHRAHLRAMAYRLLGSPSEAEDAVQDAWLRLSRADTSGVANLGAWLTTVVARVCLNMLQARTSRREEPLDAHLPEPIVSEAEGTDPEHEVLLADAVGPALLVVLDMLAPAERGPTPPPCNWAQPQPFNWAQPRRCAVRRTWPPPSRGYAPVPHGQRWSTALPEPCGRRAVTRAWSSAS